MTEKRGEKKKRYDKNNESRQAKTNKENCKRVHASRLSSEVERVAFNHVVVGSIPTDGVFYYDQKIIIKESKQKPIFKTFFFNY